MQVTKESVHASVNSIEEIRIGLDAMRERGGENNNTGEHIQGELEKIA